MTARPDALRELEREMGVVVRRVRRVIAERARSVPVSYTHLTLPTIYSV